MSDLKDTAIALEHVTKTFGDKQVLRDVTLSVARGETVCVVGRSGTGKSVTLKLIIALIKPEGGHIWIDGEDITRLEGQQLSRVRRKMGFLFQNAALFDFMTLYENLALPLRRLTHKSDQEIEEITDRVLRQVGLSGDRQKMPMELSGGMKKRAGLARALVLEPEILLVDEPSSGLDRITASEIDDLLLEQKLRTTMIIVTHDVHGARRVGERVAHRYAWDEKRYDGAMAASSGEIYEAVVALSRSLAGRTDLRSLLAGLADSLRRIVRFEHIGLILHDPNDGAMQGYILNEPGNPVITDLTLPVVDQEVVVISTGSAASTVAFQCRAAGEKSRLSTRGPWWNLCLARCDRKRSWLEPLK